MVLLLYEPIKVPVWSPQRREATNPVEILVEEKKRNWLRSWAKKRIEANRRWLSSRTKLIGGCSSIEPKVKVLTFFPSLKVESSTVLHVFVCGLVVRIFLGVLHVFDCGLVVRIF